MVQRILYLHGADAAGGGSDPLLEAIRQRWPELEIRTPHMPPIDTEDAPDLWQHEIARAIRELPDDPWVLIAHSLGASEALRLLCRHVPRNLRSMIAVAAPCWERTPTGSIPIIEPSVNGSASASGSTSAARLPSWIGSEWALPAHADRLLADLELVIVHAEDDDVVPVEHGRRLADLLPWARLQTPATGGHAPVAWVARAA